MTDDLDRPEEDGYSLAVPFIACNSQGGPYDDNAFVAGFQCGEIDRALKAIEAAGGNSAEFTVYTPLVKQVELLGMNRGFPVMTADTFDDTPEWTHVRFSASKEQP